MREEGRIRCLHLMCLKKETIKVLTGKNHSNSEQRRNFPDSNITGHNSQDMAKKKKKRAPQTGGND